MTSVLFDTNILIDALNGYKEAITELAYWDRPAISAVTWVEVYAGASANEFPAFDNFLEPFGFEVIPIDDRVMRAAAELSARRRQHGRKIALPDAIIAATAQIRHLTIITRNVKDFKGRNVRVPYELQTTCTVAVVNVHPPEPAPFPTRKNRAE